MTKRFSTEAPQVKKAWDVLFVILFLDLLVLGRGYATTFLTVVLVNPYLLVNAILALRNHKSDPDNAVEARSEQTFKIF